MTTYTKPTYGAVPPVTALPDPSEYREFVGVRGAATILADGTLRWQLVNAANKRRFLLSWVGLTGDNKTVLETALLAAATAAVAFKAPTGTTYNNVVLDQGSEELEFTAYMSAGQMLFKVGPLSFREV